MKRITVLLCLTAFLLSGCGSWMNKSYVSVEAYLEQNKQQTQTVPEVTNYIELREALVAMVENGTEEGTVIITALGQDNVNSYMDMAINHIKSRSAIGAYTVDDVTYELGSSLGKAAVAVSFAYNNNRAELRNMRRAEGMEDAADILTNALDKCEAGVVFLVEDYVSTDFAQLVQDYALAYPNLIMEIPQVSVAVYPEQGKERVVDLKFTYQTSREVLREMQDKVAPVFTSARLYVSGSAEDTEKYSQLFSLLMERYNNYTIETSITPAYSLLMHGVGDCRAFAYVYAVMCRQAGLDCQVISGTRDGESWFWNVIEMDGVQYHVDLLRCSFGEGFRMVPDTEMGGYVWDYSAYTAAENSEE